MAYFLRFNHATVAGDVIVVSMQYSSLHSFNALCFYDTAYISCVVTLHDMCVCVCVECACVCGGVGVWSVWEVCVCGECACVCGGVGVWSVWEVCVCGECVCAWVCV